MSFLLCSSSIQPAASRSRLRRGDDPDWLRLKDIICRLYATNELKDVMRIMKEDHDFGASAKLYKTKFQAWGIDTKRIKPREYKTIIQKKRKREKEHPGKSTKFRLRGEIVPDSKIARWETRMLKHGMITENDTYTEIDTPPNLTYRTPTPSIDDASPVPDVAILFSPATKSITPHSMSSPSMLSSRYPTSQWNKLVSGCSLFSGTLDDLMSLDASAQLLWRTSTPIYDSIGSPLLNSTHPTLIPVSSSSGSTPIRTPDELNLSPRFQSQAPTRLSHTPRDPSLEACDWRTSVAQYALSPDDEYINELPIVSIHDPIRTHLMKVLSQVLAHENENVVEILAGEVSGLLSSDQEILANVALPDFSWTHATELSESATQNGSDSIHTCISSSQRYTLHYYSNNATFLVDAKQTRLHKDYPLDFLMARFTIIPEVDDFSWSASVDLFIDHGTVQTWGTNRSIRKFYPYRKYDTLVVEAARTNNVAQLQQLFSSGQATPFDRTTDRHLLILCSAMGGAYDAMLFLVQQGSTLHDAHWGVHSVLWAIWLGFFDRQSGELCGSFPTTNSDFECCKGLSQIALTQGVLIEDCVHLHEEYGNLLHIPCKYTSVDTCYLEKIVRYMLQIGSDLELRNGDGLTPLLHAAKSIWSNSSAYLALLIKYGSDVSATDNEGRGPLHLVLLALSEPISKDATKIRSSYESVVSKLVDLLEAGCDPETIDRGGKSPSQYIHSREAGKAWTTALEMASKNADTRMS